MSLPQQPNDPQYQQPPVATPAPSTGLSSVDLSAITRPENRAYLIAGAGALVALLAYFILPFAGSSYSSTVLGATASYSDTGSQLASAYGVLNLVWLAALIALAVAIVLALGMRAIPQLTAQLGARILAGAGGVAFVFLAIGLLQVNGDLSKVASLGGLASIGGGHFSAGISWGAWIALLATVAMIVGGVLALRKSQA